MGGAATSSSSVGKLTFDNVFLVGSCYLSYFLVGSCYLKILPVGGSRYFTFFSWKLTFDNAFSVWKLLPKLSFCGELLPQVSTGGGEPLLHLFLLGAHL